MHRHHIAHDRNSPDNLGKIIPDIRPPANNPQNQNIVHHHSKVLNESQPNHAVISDDHHNQNDQMMADIEKLIGLPSKIDHFLKNINDHNQNTIIPAQIETSNKV